MNPDVIFFHFFMRKTVYVLNLLFLYNFSTSIFQRILLICIKPHLMVDVSHEINPLSKTFPIRVRQLEYVAFVCTPTFIGIRMILDMRTLTLTLVFSVLFFKSFQKFFWNIFLGLRRGFSFESNFNISFCRISNLSFYLSKSRLWKSCQENH